MTICHRLRKMTQGPNNNNNDDDNKILYKIRVPEEAECPQLKDRNN